MSDNTRRPGPWDLAPRPRHEPDVEGTHGPQEPPLDKGQNPFVAVVGTLLFLGVIWFFTQSLIVAVAIIFGLIVHEYGHVLAMNRLGMGPARIYIIPLLGGLAKGQRGPRNEWEGVLVSMAGPFFGLVAAVPFFVGWFLTGNAEWLVASFVIALLNLLNLAPAPPLDGSKALGPVLARIHPMVELGAMLLVGAIVIVWAFNRGSFILAGFLLLALFSHLRMGVRRPDGRPLTAGESLKSVGVYLGTALACVGVAATGGYLLTGDAVQGAGTMLGWLGLSQ